MHFDLLGLFFIFAWVEQLDLLLNISVVLCHYQLSLLIYLLLHFQHFLSLFFFLLINLLNRFRFLSHTAYIVNYFDIFVTHHRLRTWSCLCRILHLFEMHCACLFSLIDHSLRNHPKLAEVNPDLTQQKLLGWDVLHEDCVATQILLGFSFSACFSLSFPFSELFRIKFSLLT